jgi:hypothetical protein
VIEKQRARLQLNIATASAWVLCDAGGGLVCCWVLTVVDMAIKIYNFSNH